MLDGAEAVVVFGAKVGVAGVGVVAPVELGELAAMVVGLVADQSLAVGGEGVGELAVVADGGTFAVGVGEAGGAVEAVVLAGHGVGAAV